VRGSLFAVELAEEVERRKRLLILAATCAAFLQMALVLLSLLVAAVFRDTYRITSVAVMAIVYVGCGYGALARMRHEGAAGPAMSTRLEALAREKEVLVMRRHRLHARPRQAPGVRHRTDGVETAA
jgi:uncharacterized membrane protein YqjE